MAYVTEKYCIDTITKRKAKYWKLYDSDGTLIDEQQDSDTDLDKSVEQLQNALMEITGGYVIVKANNRKGKELARGGAVSGSSLEFKIQLGRVRGRDRDSGDGGNITLLRELFKVQQEYREYVMSNEFEKRIAKLEKKKSDDGMDGIMGDLRFVIRQEYLKQQGLSGTGTVDNKLPSLGTTESERQVQPGDGKQNKAGIIEAVKIFAKVDPKVGDHLLLLAKFAENHPDQYEQYLQMLKEQSGG